MVIDFKKLVVLCEDELISREYASMYYQKIRTEWDRLTQWMEEHQYTDFSEPIGFAYCDEVFGDHILTAWTNTLLFAPNKKHPFQCFQ